MVSTHCESETATIISHSANEEPKRIYYSNTLFQQSVGLSPDLSALMSGFLNTWFFVASFIPWFLIDRIGRRPLLLSMVSLMAAVMAVQTGLIYSVQNKLSNQHACGAAAAAMLFIFQGAFTVGFQAGAYKLCLKLSIRR